MLRSKNETEELIFSITRNCDTLNRPTHTKPQETLEIKLTQSNETFSFTPLISIEGCWMIWLTSLQANDSVFNITEENNEFELYTDTFDEFSITKLKAELKEILSISGITPKNLQHEIKGPWIIQGYKKRSEKSSTDSFLMLLMGYARSPLPEFEI